MIKLEHAHSGLGRDIALGLAAKNYRAIDRGVPNHQIASHQDFGGDQQPMSIAAIGAETKGIAIVSERLRSSANDNDNATDKSGA
jgi:hypothetical protein